MIKSLVIVMFLMGYSAASYADDGSKLWMNPVVNSNVKVKLQGKGTPTTDIAIKEIEEGWSGGAVTLVLKKEKGMKRDGFTISSKNGSVTLSSPSDIGLLYGAYRLLQLQTQNKATGDFTLKDNPFHDIRLLNHWDNLDGNSERGYAGKSIFWNVKGFPETIGENDVAGMRNNPLSNTAYGRQRCLSSR